MEILAICMPIFILIILGNVLFRFNLIDNVFVHTSNRLIMNIFLPVLIFNEIAESNFAEVFSQKHVMILLSAIVIMFLVSFPLARLLHLSAATTRTFVSANFRANAAFVGLPVCFYAFGDQGLSVASIYLAFIVPVNNILGIMAYSTGGFGIMEIRSTLKNTFLNPLVISCVLGMAFSILDISLPSFISETFSILSRLAMPLALLGIGANINAESIKGNQKLITVSSFMKLFGTPLLAFVMFRLLGIDSFGMLEKVAIILLAAPSAQINYIFACTMNGDPDLASGSIIVSTVLSAVAFFCWLSIMT